MALAPIDQYIVDVVRRKRTEMNWSQDYLATIMNVSRGFIGNVESTRAIEKYSTIQINELAKIFNCSPKDFWPEKPL
jgi:transcriptional regulator with XRE-family HTH domain